jgi:hypothetical protein
MAALRLSDQGGECRRLADQRAILGPEAAVQRKEPGTVGIRQISPELPFASGIGRGD